MSEYEGPLRPGPIAVELHNTIFAAGGELRDGLAEPASAAAFVTSIAPRIGLQMGEAPVDPARLVALRETVREVLAAAVRSELPELGTLRRLNAAAALAPVSVRAELSGAQLVSGLDHHDAPPGEILLSAFAADAVALITGADRLHLCGAPGCVLMFVRDRPRREWCSNACGNRARQARHDQRSRGQAQE